MTVIMINIIKIIKKIYMKMIEIILIKNGRLKIKIIIIKIIKIIKIVITMNIIKKIITHCKK